MDVGVKDGVVTATIPLDEYKSLKDQEAKLDALICAGVDNWCGYGDAMDILHGEDEDE